MSKPDESQTILALRFEVYKWQSIAWVELFLISVVVPALVLSAANHQWAAALAIAGTGIAIFVLAVLWLLVAPRS